VLNRVFIQSLDGNTVNVVANVTNWNRDTLSLEIEDKTQNRVLYRTWEKDRIVYFRVCDPPAYI